MRFLIPLVLLAIANFNCQNKVNRNTKITNNQGDTSRYVAKVEAPPPPLPPLIGSEIEDTTYLKGVFLKVDKPAVYKRGMAAFLKYAQDNTKNPICIDMEGTVYVSCVVEIDGSLSNIRTKRGIGCGWNEAAMKTLNTTSGDWISGTNEGKAVRSYIIVPIKCKIE